MAGLPMHLENDFQLGCACSGLFFSNRLPWADLADVSGVRWADPGQEVPRKKDLQCRPFVNLTSVRFRVCSVNNLPCKTVSQQMLYMGM